MGIGALNYQGVKSGIKLNDVIEEFKYAYKGQEIKAGDFVKYINGVASQRIETSEDTVLSNETSSGNVISAVVLDENRVFIAHYHPSVSNPTTTYSPLFGVVVTISGATITVGTDTQLSTLDYSSETISAVKLDGNRVFIAHCYGNNTYLSAVVCTVSGTTITAGADTSIVLTSYAGRAISTTLLDNGNVFIAHSYGSNRYLYGIVVTIDGTTITKGTDTKLIDTSNAGYSVSVEKVGEGEVFIVHSSGSSYTLNTCYCSISGTTVTRGTKYSLSSNEKTGLGIKTKLIEERKIFIAHGYGGANRLYGMILTYTGSTISNGVDVLIADVDTSQSQELAVINSGKALITYKYGTSYQLYSTICTVDGETITPHTNTQLHTNSYTHESSISVLQNGGIFIAHSDTSNYYLNGQVWGVDEVNNVLTNQVVSAEYEQQVTLATEPPFDGIALSNGVGGDDTGHNEQIKIAKPNV